MFNILKNNLLVRRLHLRQNYEKMQLINLIDQYMFKINQNLSTTNCDIEKFLLDHELDKLVKLKNKYNTHDISPKEIDDNKKELTTQYVNYINKIIK
jgi:hypothetical protein